VPGSHFVRVAAEKGWSRDERRGEPGVEHVVPIDGANASYDSVAFKASLEESARKPARVVRNDGDFAAAATVRIANGTCEVWGCFQSPQAARDLVAKRLGMSADDVTVHVTRLVPLGLEHSARVRGAVVRRRAGGGREA
jgi:hypothetical protein